MGFDVLTVVKVLVIVFWAIPHCRRLLRGYMCCGGNYSFILKCEFMASKYRKHP